MLAVLENLFRQEQMMPLSLCSKKPSLRFHAYAQRNIERILQSQPTIFLAFKGGKKKISFTPPHQLKLRYLICLFKDTLHDLKCSSKVLQTLEYHSLSNAPMTQGQNTVFPPTQLLSSRKHITCSQMHYCDFPKFTASPPLH